MLWTECQVENNNRGNQGKEAMKHRSTQFGARKNPDSPRVHGLCLTVSSSPESATSCENLRELRRQARLRILFGPYSTKTEGPLCNRKENWRHQQPSRRTGVGNRVESRRNLTGQPCRASRRECKPWEPRSL